MDGLRLHEVTAPLRSRIETISEELRAMPGYRRHGLVGEALVRERQALLRQIDELSRVPRPATAPGPKSARDRARDAKTIRALVAESEAETRAAAKERQVS